MKYQTFRTRKEANAEIAKMRGWNAKAIKLYIPDDPKANRSGDVWVIQARTANEDYAYMRADGHIG